MTDAPSGWVVLFCRLLMVFILRLFRLRYDLTANLFRPNYKTTIDNDEKAGYGRNNQLEKFFKNYYNSADLAQTTPHEFEIDTP